MSEMAGRSVPERGTPPAEARPLESTEFAVRFHELDPNGHVNHGVYANYFETARIALLDQLGLGPSVLAERGVHFVVVELRIHFRRPARAGDRLRVLTRIQQLRRASSWWHQSLHRDDDLLAEAEVRSAVTDAGGRPIAPPRDIIEALTALASPRQRPGGSP
jgi:acyl-CoA thioester hydrolase